MPTSSLALQKQLIAEGKTGPEWHHSSRPPRVEAEGTGHLMTFSELLGTHVYVVHLSCEESLAEAMRAKARGVNVWVETLIQLPRPRHDLRRTPGFRGGEVRHVAAAPRQTEPACLVERAPAAVYQHLIDGTMLRLISSARSPWGKDDFTKIPNGIAAPGRPRQCALDARRKGRSNGPCTRSWTVRAHRPQRSLDCIRGKERSRSGPMRILSSTTPDYEGTISAATQTINVDYSAFEGWPIKGRPHVVTVRGGGRRPATASFVGTIGRGKRLQREPNHF